MKNIKQLYTFIGIAIIVGFVIGQTFPNVKFYFLEPEEPKREITENLFNELQFKKIHEGSPKTFANYILRERTFNYEYAIIYGTLVFGITLLVNGIRNNIKPKKINESSIKMVE
jgi:hypothetical protein